MSSSDRRPEFLAMNPAGKLPVLVDDDLGGLTGLIGRAQRARATLRWIVGSSAPPLAIRTYVSSR
jgi:hypothetical protein